VLALLAANVVGVLLFATLYATAGARLMPQGAFVACLVLIFTLITWLWVRVEARHRALEPLRRLGRAAAALCLVVIGVPIVVLMPVFWLESQLPAEAEFTRYLAPIMTLVLISLTLVVFANVIGAAIAGVSTVFGTKRRRP
jgi:hypothetical protein